MNTARKGRAFEHEIRKLLRAAGFSVIRGAGSKGELLDEKVDLVATKLTRDTEYTAFLTVIGVQCKAKARK
ncbi:MAG TPA: restriction endonuclease [Terriglobales bacterium]|nr:restriction endonuclease [Terriglobales bacterium]